MAGNVNKLTEIFHQQIRDQQKNRDLTAGDWSKMSGSVKGAFKGPVKLVTLPAGFGLFKLATHGPKYFKGGFVTPWWSPLNPFKEDWEGARSRFKQARANGVTMSAMVRFMSAVCIDWNDLDKYFEITTTCELKAFWGMFAPQPYQSAGEGVRAPLTKQQATAMGDAVLPDELGVLEAWQLYIPYLEERYFRATPSIAAHDSAALANHFGL